MITIYPSFKSDTATVYDEKEVPQGEDALIQVPGDVGALSIDIYAAEKPCRYSIYVSNAKDGDIKAGNDKVHWHPTPYQEVNTDMFAVVSGVVGGYMIKCLQGRLEVQVRGK